MSCHVMWSMLHSVDHLVKFSTLLRNAYTHNMLHTKGAIHKRLSARHSRLLATTEYWRIAALWVTIGRMRSSHKFSWITAGPLKSYVQMDLRLTTLYISLSIAICMWATAPSVGN